MAASASGAQHDSLAGAQSIRLDHQRPVDTVQRGIRFLRRVVRAIHFCGRNIVPKQKFFRKNLAAFELRRLLQRAHNGPVSLRESVGDAVHKRQLRADNRQVRRVLFGQGHETGNVASIQRDALRVGGDAAVAWCAPNFFYARALLQLPNQRMLAPAAANHQNLHPKSLSQNSHSNDSRPITWCQLSGSFRLRVSFRLLD